MKRVFRVEVLLLVLFNLSAVFNYLFQVVLGHWLSPETFGSFNGLNSSVLLVLAPTSVAPLVVAKYTVMYSLEERGRIVTLLYRGVMLSLATALLLMVLGVAGLPWIKAFLQESDSIPVLLALGNMFISVLLPIPLGVLQGMQRFLGYTLAGLFQTMGRFAFGILFVVLLPWSENGAFLASMLGTLLAVASSLFFLRDTFSGKSAPLPKGTIKQMALYAVPALFTSSFGLVLSNIDLVLVRHFCSPVDSGLYSAAAVLSRIGLFAPGLILAMLFPRVAKCREDGSSDAGALLSAVLGTVFIAGGFALLCIFCPEVLIGIFFGQAQFGSAPLLKILGVTMAIMALIQLFFTYGLAKSSFGYIWSLTLGIVFFPLAVIYRHDSPMEIAWALLATMLLVFVSVLVWHHQARKHDPSQVALLCGRKTCSFLS